MAFDRNLFVFASTLGLIATSAAAGDRPTDVELGRQLFEKSWLRLPADDSPLAIAEGGDGLGPLFNGASCVECHRLGGSGGAGPNEHNVDVVSVVVPLGADEKTRSKLLQRAAAFHPAFRQRSDVVLHRFGFDEEGEFVDYESFRSEILARFPELPSPATATQIETPNGVPLQLAQRNTPAMFGDGVIDQVSVETLQALAARQRAESPKQAGRPSLGGAGRFGWRAQVDSLESFVRTACAEECGLRVRSTGRMIIDQSMSPLEGRKSRPVRAPVDLSDSQVDALVAFSASLPAPRPVPPEDLSTAAKADAGRQLFGEIGCAVCHVEHVGPARHIYSDLLLHDMGPVLADRVKAPEAGTEITQFSDRVIGSVSYYGPPRTLTKTFVDPPSLNDVETTAREWKTPPLWGVADSAPYLHDGRAPTLDEAIREHGGQGTESAVEYVALTDQSRSELMTFLGTLQSPQVD
ncbi:MAG: di-heme oxidoredictase family protein [Planctomycetaceae bacterium]